MRPQTPGETAIRSADWSMNPPAVAAPGTPVRSRSPSVGGKAWDTVKPASEFGGSDAGSMDGRVDKGKIPEAIDFRLLEGIATI